MDIIRILATILLVAVMIYAMTKKMNGAMILMGIGLLTLAIVTLITGKSVLPDESTGSRFFDIFQVTYTRFTSSLPTTTLQVMSVMGYVAFLNHIKASQMLTAIVVKPLQKLKNKYLVISLTMALGIILRIFIPSQVSLCALFLATMYPVLLALGFSRLTAASTCVVGTVIDWGPGCPNTGWVFNQPYIAEITDISTFFVRYQVPVVIISSIVMIVLFTVFTKMNEEKVLTEEKEEFGETEIGEALTAESFDVPKFYGLLPLFPIVLVLVFSKLFISSVTLSVATAHIFCFVVAFIINIIFSKKPITESFNGSQEMWTGMGNAMASAGILVAAGTTFSAGLSAIGGTNVLMDALAASSLGGSVSTAVSTALATFIAFMTGSGAPGLYTAVPLLPDVAAAAGMDVLGMIVPILVGGAIGRAISMVAPAVLIAASTSGVTNLKIVKRNLIPCLAAVVIATIASVIMF